MTDNALPKVTEMPPWWLSLPEDFYSQSDGTELDGRSIRVNLAQEKSRGPRRQDRGGW